MDGICHDCGRDGQKLRVVVVDGDAYFECVSTQECLEYLDSQCRKEV